jgi:chromosome segregation ATPase
MSCLNDLQDHLLKIGILEKITLKLDQTPESDSLFYIFEDKQLLEQKCTAYKNLVEMYRICVNKYFEKCDRDVDDIKQNLENNISTCRSKIALLEKEKIADSQENETKFTQMTDLVTSKNSEIMTLSEHNDELCKKLTSTEQLIKWENDEIAQLNSRVSELNNTISSLKNSADDKDQLITKLQRKIDPLQNRVKTLNLLLECKDKELSAKNNEMLSIQKQTSVTEAKMSAVFRSYVEKMNTQKQTILDLTQQLEQLKKSTTLSGTTQ